MACFLVPGTEAIVITAVAQIMKHNAEKKAITLESNPVTSSDTETVSNAGISFYKKLMWLADLLWGGVFLLAFEHVWHGEVVPWFPFLTAASNAADASAMLHEMATVGVTMAILVTAVWGGIVLITNAIEKRPSKELSA